MVGENGYPETPDWHLPPKTTAEPYEAPAVPENIVLGSN